MAAGNETVQIVRVGDGERDEAIEIVSEYLESIRDHVEAIDVVDEVEGHIHDAGNAMWIAREGDSVAGCIAIHPLNDDSIFEIKRLYVRPQFRGHRIGGELMSTAESFAGECGAHEVYLDTKSTMHEAISLYGKLGYQPIAPYHETTRADVFLKKQIR